ncbi:MAG: hypothetical protein HHAS10_03090 [Candidatus Altimarinota bacterium]
MSLQILEFTSLGNPEDEDFLRWKHRYDKFGLEVAKKIKDSGRSTHVLLSNINSLRSVLGRGYKLKKYNNGMKFLDSMEELYNRVRLPEVRVVVIDAVYGLIEVSESVNEVLG